MKTRVPDLLKQMGYGGDVAEFRRLLAEVKREKYSIWTDEGLIVTRDQSGEFCHKIRKRLHAPRLTRPFILRSPIGLRKNKPKLARQQPTDESLSRPLSGG